MWWRVGVAQGSVRECSAAMHSHGEVGRWQRSQTVFVNIGRCSARGGARGGQMVGPGAGWGLKPSTGVVHVVTRVAGCGVADWQGVGDFRGGGCGERGNGRGRGKVKTGAVQTFCSSPAK